MDGDHRGGRGEKTGKKEKTKQNKTKKMKNKPQHKTTAPKRTVHEPTSVPFRNSSKGGIFQLLQTVPCDINGKLTHKNTQEHLKLRKSFKLHV